MKLACYPNGGFNKAPLKGTIVVERGIEGRNREANMMTVDGQLTFLQTRFFNLIDGGRQPSTTYLLLTSEMTSEIFRC